MNWLRFFGYKKPLNEELTRPGFPGSAAPVALYLYLVDQRHGSLPKTGSTDALGGCTESRKTQGQCCKTCPLTCGHGWHQTEKAHDLPGVGRSLTKAAGLVDWSSSGF